MILYCMVCLFLNRVKLASALNYARSSRAHVKYAKTNNAVLHTRGQDADAAAPEAVRAFIIEQTTI